MVDDGDRPVAGSGEGVQSLDLRGDHVSVVARLVHVEQAAVELDPQVPAQGVQRAQRVGPHPLGAARVEPDEDRALELEPTDHLEHTGIGTLRAGHLLRRRRLLWVPIEDVPADCRRKASTDEEAFEMLGICVDVGHLNAAEVIGPVHPVVVEEPAADHVPLVDDQAVDLEHDQQPVGRIGGADVGEVLG